jgi:hypothetical protein
MVVQVMELTKTIDCIFMLYHNEAGFNSATLDLWVQELRFSTKLQVQKI